VVYPLNPVRTTHTSRNFTSTVNYKGERYVGTIQQDGTYSTTGELVLHPLLPSDAKAWEAMPYSTRLALTNYIRDSTSLKSAFTATLRQPGGLANVYGGADLLVGGVTAQKYLGFDNPVLTQSVAYV